MTVTEEKTVPNGIDDIRLFLPKANDLPDSSMSIAWCLSPEFRAYLTEKELLDSHLLIVVTHGLKETRRYLAPLLAGCCHIAFRYSGINTVRAVVVWQLKSGYPFKVSKLLKSDSNGYRTSVLELVDEELTRLKAESHAASEAYRECRDRRNALGMQLRDLTTPIYSVPAVSDPDSEDVERIRIMTQMNALHEEMLQLDGSLASSLIEQISDANQELDVYNEEIDRLAEEVRAREKASQCHLEILRDADYGWSEFVAELDVVIPAGMFGQSWAITKWLAGLQEWPAPARDNCHLRKRAIGSIPWAFVKLLKPPVMKIAYAFFTIPLLLLLIWMKIMRYENVPFVWIRNSEEHFAREAWEGRGRSMWFYAKNVGSDDPPKRKEEPQPRPIWQCWLAPPILVSIASMVAIGYAFIGEVGALVAAGIITLVVILTLFGNWAFETFDAWTDRRQKYRVARFVDELDMIGCETVSKNDPGHGLVMPRKRRVVYVLQGAKSKVCKPLEG